MSILPAFLNRTAALRPFFEDDTITEIEVNGPSDVWIMRQGSRYATRAELTRPLATDTLHDIADLIAHHSKQQTSATNPLLAATIPADLTGAEGWDYRFQYVQPPAVPAGTVSITIRKPSRLEFDLDYYVKSGAFSRINEPLPEQEDDERLVRDAHAGKDWPAFFKLIMKARKNILVSAATNTGKSAFINMLMTLANPEERVVTLEDAREIRLSKQKNVVHLLYSRGQQGVAKVSPVELMEATLRMSPDRVIPGELRGAEAYVALEMLNSGHDGWLSTIHAKSPAHMWDRLAQMVMRFGTPMMRAEIIEYAKGLIDVVIQMHRFDDGLRGVREVWYAGH
ncbi:P-type DNA transfer ATPase VirB11 [Burkholderia ambifaria]|uniref:P-type DNA transfer ATPase VirB11 n=1 Tax=Burkholderia ambifaria TaxID=152480 RepID=UPI00158E0526|nr:P-type DNA transfer ATPase VirB11 [Burkholderia ambifaria]